jgi:cytochrome c-type biogenesis protein CcmF
MAPFGTLTLLIALVVATYAGTASVVGARRRSQRLIESGRAAAYGLAAVLALSSMVIVYAFVTHDYSIKYVQRYSDASSPLFYKITAYWGGLDGSILFWVFLLATFSAIAIYTNRNRHREIMPYVVATLMAICNFFLFVIIFHKNPFDTFLTDTPTTGQGLNPLLQNGYMITHPPSLYIGFVGMSIPYAFAMGALISGHLDDAWIVAVRRWTLIAWFFLSMGLTLGMLWAYEELGWGGFWAWDPVENAGFLPWLTGTAFFHSVMIQERRGMMKIWNFTLVILTFFLTIIGTFLTRSGIVQSVHAFGQDTKLAIIFGCFMGLTLLVSFGFLVARLPELRSRGRLESLFSREAAFLLNNWILLFAAFFVLFATLFPTLSESITGERITVGEPFYNKWMVPVGLTLLFLTGVGPLIAWRKATVSHLRYQFTGPGLTALVALVATIALKLYDPSWAPVICFTFCAFVTGTVVQEFYRGAKVRSKNTGSDLFTALLGMIVRGRRRYGGYVVHLGIVLMFIGFAGQAYQKEEEVRLTPGQEQPFGRYVLRYDGLSHSEDRQKEMITGEFTVFMKADKGKPIGHLRPGRWFFHKSPGSPTTEVAIRRAPSEDLYLTLGNYNFADGSGMFKLVINPLIDWVWLGFMMLAIGTGIALLPESILSTAALRAGAPGGTPASGSAPGGGAATLLVLVGAAAALLGAARPAHARTAAETAAERKWLLENMMCMCSCRARMSECPMTVCHARDPDKETIDAMLAQGKSRDDILAFFKQKYGGMHFLMAPPDEGFNRLAWALPYGLGLAGAGVAAFGAWRFSRRGGGADPGSSAGPTAAPGKAPPADPDLEDRLDDELSKIDT